MGAKYVVNFLYRDGANYKTGFNLEIDAEEYPEVLELKQHDTIEMGQLGTENQDMFFSEESKYHGERYYPDESHNLLDVMEIWSKTCKIRQDTIDEGLSIPVGDDYVDPAVISEFIYRWATDDRVEIWLNGSFQEAQSIDFEWD